MRDGTGASQWRFRHSWSGSQPSGLTVSQTETSDFGEDAGDTVVETVEVVEVVTDAHETASTCVVSER